MQIIDKCEVKRSCYGDRTRACSQCGKRACGKHCTSRDRLIYCVKCKDKLPEHGVQAANRRMLEAMP